MALTIEENRLLKANEGRIFDANGKQKTDVIFFIPKPEAESGYMPFYGTKEGKAIQLSDEEGVEIVSGGKLEEVLAKRNHVE